MILVTGAAGFIGFHLCRYLLSRGERVIGLDNLNNYYDINLKISRLTTLKDEYEDSFKFHKMDLMERQSIGELFENYQFQKVVHLAAQAGVRYSLENPYAYIDSNLTGFAHILEGCRHTQVKHLVFASSSSVYGSNGEMPFSVHHNVDHPISLYAATKKANELMAHSYSHLYEIPTTGLRFFTVYGPWGRPDMALFSFTKSILENQPIQVYNHGKMRRDFTYIDDIVEAMARVLDRTPQANPHWSSTDRDPGCSHAPYKLYNIGHHHPVELGYFIEVLEDQLGMMADKNMLPMQPGDLLETYADIDDLVEDIQFTPQISIETGIKNFVEWYREYYHV